MLGEGLGEEKDEEDVCFTLLYIFEACNTRPSELTHNSNFLLW